MVGNRLFIWFLTWIFQCICICQNLLDFYKKLKLRSHCERRWRRKKELNERHFVFCFALSVTWTHAGAPMDTHRYIQSFSNRFHHANATLLVMGAHTHTHTHTHTHAHAHTHIYIYIYIVCEQKLYLENIWKIHTNIYTHVRMGADIDIWILILQRFGNYKFIYIYIYIYIWRRIQNFNISFILKNFFFQ